MMVDRLEGTDAVAVAAAEDDIGHDGEVAVVVVVVAGKIVSMDAVEAVTEERHRISRVGWNEEQRPVAHEDYTVGQIRDELPVVEEEAVVVQVFPP